jgi:UDP-N-acetylglucosamine acyltransferase
MNIHQTAIISPEAKLGKDVSVGPYSVISGDADIGPGCSIGAHCLVGEFTRIGSNCQIFSGAVIGSVTQDKKFDKKKSFLEIGNNNIIREYVTINRGTSESSKTKIGNNCLLMAYSHVAHDCIVGDNVVIANCGTLAGHVVLGNNVIIGGLSAVHQFVRIGSLAIIGGCSKVVQDIVPYAMADGHPAKVYTVNMLGLRRAKFPDAVKEDLRRAFKLLFFMKLNIKNAIAKIEQEIRNTKEISDLIDFVKASERGIAR